MFLFHPPCPKANGYGKPHIQTNVMFDSSHVTPDGQIKGQLIMYSMFTTWGNLLCKESGSSHAVSVNRKCSEL